MKDMIPEGLLRAPDKSPEEVCASWLWALSGRAIVKSAEQHMSKVGIRVCFLMKDSIVRVAGHIAGWRLLHPRL